MADRLGAGGQAGLHRSNRGSFKRPGHVFLPREARWAVGVISEVRGQSPGPIRGTKRANFALAKVARFRSLRVSGIGAARSRRGADKSSKLSPFRAAQVRIFVQKRLDGMRAIGENEGRIRARAPRGIKRRRNSDGSSKNIARLYAR
jgi:hypothetical protein